MIKRCEICGREFMAQRSTAKYCSARCRQMARRGIPYEGEPGRPDVRISMTDDEVAEVVQRAHVAASDLSRASMLTPAPLCRSLKKVSQRFEDALGAEGL